MGRPDAAVRWPLALGLFISTLVHAKNERDEKDLQRRYALLEERALSPPRILGTPQCGSW